MVKIIAGICCNNTKPKTIASLMQLAYSRLIDGWVVGGIGLLPSVRNDVIKKVYMNEPEFTHILFIDDDMSDFTHDHVQALLDADKPIISGLITSRVPPFKLISNLESKSKEEIIACINEQRIIEEPHVGMAFTLIKKQVIDTLAQPCDIWFTMDRMPRQSFLKETQTFLEGLVNSSKPEFDRYKEAIAWGRTSFLGSELIGEDVEFCHRARFGNFKSYTHCGVIVGHIGTNPYTVRDNFIERELKYVDENASSNVVVS